ncbi:thiamine biosynthesis protein ThiF [Flavobacterium psychrophilum]|uniref:Molybdopterin-synthase adenylyltransferase n=4 Tax=Flavobacterium psychrophilum TaxID=96345 RepID=A6GWS2_FLAPJ|nr:HesA/MoeB/ThiF family protein [Flavobacterium psychrophilum]AIG29350.1 thiamine biosynthesis protein ThiF [Flavobacterium psychrophilum]AIG31627.1 thiamine biosynthesis protein ThiF [Flavobacterium psychrophilum]AIG33781.1 thiamine biosynthesis protein ThiF [Flavobacterium psychrophilum]AIG36143.1 thiamine biosynthesis protein ThiF [Flavobacterium psychrophilum]AIG38409.1 thiamine biosynthesis protein ThiF [Flavobacterium psychrophilum]
MSKIQEFLRYNRQTMLPEIGDSGQEKLKKAKVLVIGAGGLGCPVLQYISTAGVGTIGIVDFDKIEMHNLHRQILYTEKQVGLSKALTAKERLEKLNPLIDIIAFDEKLTFENATQIIQKFDVVLDGCDNFETRYLVNDTCVALGKTLVYGSILKYQGQMAIFNHNGSKNLRHLFPEPPNSSDVPNCNLNGVIGTLPGIIGTMMGHETLKLIIDLPVLKNELVLFDTLYWDFRKLKF